MLLAWTSMQDECSRAFSMMIVAGFWSSLWDGLIYDSKWDRMWKQHLLFCFPLVETRSVMRLLTSALCVYTWGLLNTFLFKLLNEELEWACCFWLLQSVILDVHPGGLNNEKCKPNQITVCLVMKQSDNLLEVLNGFIIVGPCCILFRCILFGRYYSWILWQARCACLAEN